MEIIERNYADLLLNQAEEAGFEIVVGGLILNAEGHFFVQRRSPTRRLFPGCWDIVGGHLEAGESLAEGLAREIREETGWILKDILLPVGVYDWTDEKPAGVQWVREFDFIVTVEEAGEPQLEVGKVDAYRWIGPDETSVLLENRMPNDRFIIDLVESGFAALKKCGLKL